MGHPIVLIIGFWEPYLEVGHFISEFLGGFVEVAS